MTDMIAARRTRGADGFEVLEREEPIVQLELALRVVSEANKRGHWAKGARRAAEQRAIARMALHSRMPRLDSYLPPAWINGVLTMRHLTALVVHLVRVAPRELDDDNLQRALKAVRDGIADGLGVDDRDRRVSWTYGQDYGGVKRYGVRVTISEAKEELPR